MTIKIIIFVLVAVGFVAFVLLWRDVSPPLNDTRYFVPLVGGLGIEHQCDGPGDPETHTFIAGRTSPRFFLAISEKSVSGSSELDVAKVAVVGSVIVGTADPGGRYFMFDTSAPATFPVANDARVFADRESWIRAMRDAGIKEIPTLSDPAHLAAGVPDRVLHSDDYYKFHGYFGWNDHAWSERLDVFSLLCLFMLGFLLPDSNSLFGVTVATLRLLAAMGLGLIVSVYGEVGVSGDSAGLPGAVICALLLWGTCKLGSFCGRATVEFLAA